MSSELEAKVDDLAETVARHETTIEIVDELHTRIQALEKNQAATTMRLDRIDRVVASIQGDVRSLNKAIARMDVAQTKQFEDLRELVSRVLIAVQPKVTM
jgi:chromosome segregation ATPase